MCARQEGCSEPRRAEPVRFVNRTVPRYAIVVHGGCGHWSHGHTRAALSGVRAALAAGRKVVVLGDNPLFNAGTGSTLTRDGDAEMDASVMVGEGLRCGGVAAIRRVKNP